MNMPSQRGLTAVAVCLIGLSAAGCIDTPKGGLSYMNPLYRDAPIDSAYGPTPDQQIATLRRTARSAKRLSAQQQSQTSGKLVSQLQNEVDPLIRVEIVRTLSVFPTAAAAYGMKQAIEDNNVKVRVAACEGWANLRGDEAINVLAEKLASSTEDDVRLAAARALGKFRGSEAAVQALAVCRVIFDVLLDFRILHPCVVAILLPGRVVGGDVVHAVRGRDG